MLGITDLSDLCKELVHLLVYFVSVLTYSAIPHLYELLLENLEVVVKSLHHIYDQRSQVHCFMVFMLINSTHFADESFIAVSAELCQRKRVKWTHLCIRWNVTVVGSCSLLEDRMLVLRHDRLVHEGMRAFGLSGWIQRSLSPSLGGPVQRL